MATSTNWWTRPQKKTNTNDMNITRRCFKPKFFGYKIHTIQHTGVAATHNMQLANEAV